MGVPYGGTLAVDTTGETFDCRKSAGGGKYYLAGAVEVVNRIDSANAVDIGYDGVTWFRRLNPGQSFKITSADSPVKIQTLYAKCAAGTATIEVQCEYAVGVPV